MYTNLHKIFSFQSLIEKKLWGSKNPENSLFKKVTRSKKCFNIFIFSLSFVKVDSNFNLVFNFHMSKIKIANFVANLKFGRKSAYF